MKSAPMASLKHHFSPLGLHKKPQLSIPISRKTGTLTVTCGLRDASRQPLWKSRVLSSEAIQAVHALKLAKSSSKLEEVFHGRVCRLLKADLLDTLSELRRQDELDLALEVFHFVRKEVWYKPDLSLYCDMILQLGKNKQITMAEELFCELKKEGLVPDTRAYTEMIGAYLQVGMIDKAMETYKSMKMSGCAPHKLTLTILIRNLEKAGEEELAMTVRKDCAKYVEYPRKFLEEVDQKHKESLAPSYHNHRPNKPLIPSASSEVSLKERYESMKRPEPFVWRKNTGVENYGSLVECEKCGFIDESTESASRDEKTLTVRCTVYFKCPNCAAEKTVAVRSVRLRKRPNLKKRMCGGEEEETEVPEVL